MLINLTNHPSHLWGEAQKTAAAKYGECIDIPFPNIPEEIDSNAVDDMANEYLEKILALGPDVTVHIMGEQTFCFALISKLFANHIPCIASCTRRDVTILPDGTELKRFYFARFREYCR